jgi:hypothetical protein
MNLNVEAAILNRERYCKGERMKAAVVLENAPESELARWEFEYSDEDEVDEKVSSILDGVRFSVGDIIRIVAL